MNLNKFNTNEDQVQAICDFIKKYIAETKKERIVIAVSGGKSPILLFQQLRTQLLSWHNIDITLVDERLVEQSSEDSNGNLVRTYLLQDLAQEARFIPLVISDNMDKNLEHANSISHNIDIAILGMGEDGHTASIFPDCQELDMALTTQQQYIITNPQSAKFQRIGLSMHALWQIPCVILSINGKTKLDLLTEAMRGLNRNYPISYLLHSRQNINTFWYD